MSAITRSRLAIAIPALIFLACTLISFSSTYKIHGDKLSLAIILDLLITAPLLYFLLIRKTTLPKISVLRVFMAGVLVAGLLVSKNNAQVLSIIKIWISPVIEMSLVGFICWKFYIAKKQTGKNNVLSFDFLFHCRAILRSVFGNEKIANAIASEVAVFYYTFCKKEKHILNTTRFTSYKENGIILILGTFLCLFIIETAGMHFVFRLWNKTAAWTLTIASFYTCIQLFAHIRALKLRSTIISGDTLFIRNGLLGGDAVIHIDNIQSVVKTNKPIPGTGVVKIGLFKGLEKNNLAIYLGEPVTVIKAFGMKKNAKTIVLSIDKCEDFIATLAKPRI